ncbi:MAG: WG repeat-containing protein [Clostridiales bacterium]|nr:WG repeat-containing protein [Clostridiales bacterium]
MLEKKHFFAVCASLLLFLIGFFPLLAGPFCSKASAFDDILLPFQNPAGLRGFQSLCGEEVLSPFWDEVGPFVNGYAKIVKGEKIGFINLQGEVTVPPQWDFATNFFGGYAKVGLSDLLYNHTYNDYREGYYYIDPQGNLLSPIIWGDCSIFVNELALVEKNFKWGFLSSEGHLLSPLQWDDIYPLTSEVFPTQDFSYIDGEGGEIWSSRSLFVEGLIVVVTDGLCGLINEDFQLVLPPSWGHISAIKEGILVVQDQDSGLYGYIDTKGVVLIPPLFDRAQTFTKGIAAVEKNGRAFWINLDGEEVDPPSS